MTVGNAFDVKVQVTDACALQKSWIGKSSYLKFTSSIKLQCIYEKNYLDYEYQILDGMEKA